MQTKRNETDENEENRTKRIRLGSVSTRTRQEDEKKQRNATKQASLFARSSCQKKMEMQASKRTHVRRQDVLQTIMTKGGNAPIRPRIPPRKKKKRNKNTFESNGPFFELLAIFGTHQRPGQRTHH